MAYPTNPKYDGTDGGPIDLATAKKWVKNFRDSVKDTDEVRSHYFGCNVISKILQQEGCTGLRIYYALNDKHEKEILILGVNDKGVNMLPASGVLGDGGNTIADISYPCPPTCPPDGDL